MDWTLTIWDAAKTASHSIDVAGPSGVSGGFSWQRRGNGDCVQLEWAGVNARMGVGPRSIVQLSVGGVAQFYGIVPDPPSANNPSVDAVLALGGKEALRLALLDGTVYRSMGIYAIVRDILDRLCPPAVTYDPAAIGAGDGPVLDLYYAPTADLVSALDTLAKSAAVEWWVDEQGVVNFRPPSTETFAFTADPSSTRYLQVQGRETCTRAVLRIASSMSATPNLYGAARQQDDGTSAYDQPYLPATITTVATSPDHATYAASKAVEVPEGVSVVRQVSVPDIFGPSSPATDGDDTTALTVTQGDPQKPAAQGTATQRPAPVGTAPEGDRVIGARVHYSLDTDQTIGEHALYLRLTYLTQQGVPTSAAFWSMPKTESGAPAVLTYIFPPDVVAVAERYGANVAVMYPETIPGATLKIYELSFIMVNEDAAQRLAGTFLHTPAPSPAEITLSGLHPPLPKASGSGISSADGAALVWEYEHSPESPTTTRIRLGSDGQSGAARAIKFAVGG